jgi:hypothetical protein
MAAAGGKGDRGEEPGDYRPRRFFEAEPGGKTNIQKMSFGKTEDPGYDLFKPNQEELSVFSEPGRLEDESDAASPGVTRQATKLDDRDRMIKDQTEELYDTVKDIQTNGVDIRGQMIPPYYLELFGLVPLDDSQFSFENAQLFINHLEDVIAKIDKYLQIIDLQEEDESEGEFLQAFLASYAETYGPTATPLYSTFKHGGFVQPKRNSHRVGRMK